MNKMNAFLLRMLTASANATQMTSFEGAVTTTDGVTIEGLLYSYVSETKGKLEPVPESLDLRIENQAGEEQRYSVNTSDIEKIIYSSQQGNKCSRGGDYYTSQVVILKNGRQFEQKTCKALLMPENSVYVTSRHPITGELAYDRIRWQKVKEIRLLATSGQIRKDCLGNSFPSDYLFSPYTGEKMPLVPVQ